MQADDLDTDGSARGRRVMKKLCVWWDGRIVGELVQDAHSNMRFEYGDAWLADSRTPALSRMARAGCTRRISARPWRSHPSRNTSPKEARVSRSASVWCGAPRSRPAGT